MGTLDFHFCNKNLSLPRVSEYPVVSGYRGTQYCTRGGERLLLRTCVHGYPGTGHPGTRVPGCNYKSAMEFCQYWNLPTQYPVPGGRSAAA
eukprot:1438461-Rhodomonas_salina.1